MLKALFKLIFFLILILALLFIFAPNLISTKAGKTAFLKLYKSITKNVLQVETLELSWWKGQKFQNIEWSDRRHQMTLTISQAETTATLWQVLFYHDLGDLQIISLKATIAMLPSLPSPPPKAQAGFIPTVSLANQSKGFTIPYYGKIHLQEGAIQFLNQGLPPINLAHLNLEASLLKSQVKVSGSATTSEQTPKGNLNLSLLYLPQSTQIDLSLQLDQFPTRSLDQIVFFKEPALQGSLIGAIGETLNVDLKLQHLQESLSLSCLAQSQNLSAKIETKTENGVVSLGAPATLQFELPPALFQKLTSIAIVEPFSGNLNIENLSIPLSNQDNFAFQATLHAQIFPAILGRKEPVSVFLTTENFKSRNFTVKLETTQLQVNSSLYLPSLWDELRLKGEALLANQTHIDFSIETLAKIAAHVQGPQIQGDIEGSYNLKSGQAVGKFSMDPFRFQGIPFSSNLGSFTADLIRQKGNFQISSQIDQGSLQASGSFSSFQNATAHLVLSQIPVTLAHLFLQNPPPLEALIGPTVEAVLDLTYEPQKQNFSCTLSSQNLKLTSALVYADSTLSSFEPTQLALKVSPEGYAAFDKWLNQTETTLQLTEPAIINATFATLMVPLNNLSHALYQANATIDRLAFAQGRLSQIAAKFSHASLTAPITFQLKATPSQGSANISGSFDFLTGCTELQTQIDQFPTEALDLMARSLGQTNLSFAALLGPKLNLTSSAALTSWSGPVNLELNTAQVRASLKGRVMEGILTLSEPLHLQMSLSRESSQALLKSLNPLSISSFSSEGPITLVIPKEGFSCPLHPFNDAKIEIPAGRLELGKMVCHNEGNLNATLGLLKLSQYSNNQDLQLWFAPLDFGMKQGLLKCERTEILIANNYQVCTWGDVDFTSHYVDMTLGVTASCLKKAFGLEGLPSSYVLQIPMQGPFNDVKIDTSAATGKITAIMLWQQRSNLGNIGGKAGSLLGKFVDQAIPFPDRSKAPPPKHPFPWETQAPSKPKKTSSLDPKKKKIDPTASPLKQAVKLLR